MNLFLFCAWYDNITLHTTLNELALHTRLKQHDKARALVRIILQTPQLIKAKSHLLLGDFGLIKVTVV